MELQKKISVSKVFGKINAAIIAKKGTDNKLFVGTFYGSANDVETGTSDFGDWRALKGIFRAISPEGQVFESGKCFLPDVALDLVCGQLLPGTSVDFAFKLYAVMDEESQVGYTYRAEPLMQAKDDPLARIAGLLAAPKPEPKPEPDQKSGKSK